MTMNSIDRRSAIHLDGTTLEGGGQLLRIALSISSLTQIPIHVTDIRGKRGPKSNPGKAGGMKPAHLAGAAWLAYATNADVTGLEMRSRNLIFQPAKVTGGECLTSNNEGFSEAYPRSEFNGVWNSIYEAGRLVRHESHISLATPGSIFLILQAVLPYILFTIPSAAYEPNTPNKPTPVRLTIEGGTNVFNSPSYEYISQVLFPILHAKLGIMPINMTLHRRGWSTGRADVGKVTFEVVPLEAGSVLAPFSLQNRGDLVAIHTSLFASSAALRARIRDVVTEKILKHFPDVDILYPVDEDSKHDKRLYLLLVAETSNGYRLARDWLYDEKIQPDRPEKTINRLVSKVVQDLIIELGHGGCVDEFMQDQLVVYQALAGGKTIVDGGGASLHTRTAQWVINRLLGIGMEGGSCHGIGYRCGQGPWTQSSIASPNVAQELTSLTLKD